MTRLAVLLLLCALAAGCGSSANLFTLTKTRECLKDKHTVKFQGKLDFVASTATGGAAHLVLPHNAVTLVFGATIDDANNINDAYHRFHAKNVGVEDIIRQDTNAVMLFRQHPTADDITTIQACLK